MVIGQPEAVAALCDAYRLYWSRLMPPRRPVAVLLFLGPTGCGKTRSVEALAECLYGTPDAVLKIDCGEYQDHHEVAKLIGAPPGYLGHRETQPLLSLDSLRQYCKVEEDLSIVLFDEIEKAHPALWNLLLGILDKAEVRLGDNRKTTFQLSLIVLTGNVGAREMQSLLTAGMGFHTQQSCGRSAMARAAVRALRRRFSPEFINRLDKIIVFEPLDEQALRKILDIEIDAARQRLARGRHHLSVRVSEHVKERMLAEGTDVRYGARHLRRVVEDAVIRTTARLVADGCTQDGDCIAIEWDDGWRARVAARARAAV